MKTENFAFGLTNHQLHINLELTKNVYLLGGVEAISALRSNVYDPEIDLSTKQHVLRHEYQSKITN